MLIRLFDLNNEDPEQLWALFRDVYGTDGNARKRWNWEVEQHPLKDRVRIFVAEAEGKIVGMTVRLPIQLVTADKIYDAEFGVNTMVHPDFRRQGVVKSLYQKAIEGGNLQLSKGAMPAMVRQLEAMGYREIPAAKTYVFLLAPARWLFLKITGRHFILPKFHLSNLKSNYSQITDFSEIAEGVSSGSTLSGHRTAAFMNWRYRDIPHRNYECFVRTSESLIIAWFVLRFSESTAFLVDLSWLPEKESLKNLVQSAIRTARSCGAVKMIYWGTLLQVTKEMKRQGGWERPVQPGFRYFSRDRFWDDVQWENAHFVQGDGDYDYL